MPNDTPPDDKSPDCGPNCGGPRVRAIPPGEDRERLLCPDCGYIAYQNPLIVVGAENSSNSQRLREVAERAGCPVSRLVARAADIDWPAFEGLRTLGVTAGASAPEVLVDGVIGALSARFALTVEEVAPTRETVTFKLPRQLVS